MKTKHIYLLIAVLGTIIPYYHFGKFLLENGLNLNLFFKQMLQNNISSFFSWDVIVSSLAVITFVFVEGAKMKMKNLWLYILFNLTVGVSLALPAFLYARQLKIDKLKNY